MDKSSVADIEAAARVVARLRKIGIRRMTIISGDNQQVVDAVAREVGLDVARGDLMPDEQGRDDPTGASGRPRCDDRRCSAPDPGDETRDRRE